MKIREMNSEDIPLLARLLKNLEAAEWARERPVLEIEAELSERCLKNGASSTVLVSSTPEGGLSGYGSVHWMPNFVLPGIEGYVSELFVASEYRGQGIGDSILREIERRASLKGCHRLSLLNLRNRESYRRGFYLKRNWEERMNAANMIKKLGPRGSSAL
jgi:GNAT superfamily N-acetyltransferase